MHPSRLLPGFIVFTLVGLLVTRQQVTKTLLLYQIQNQEKLTRRLGDKYQILNYQVSALASPERLTSALAQRTLSLDGPPVAVVRVGKKDETQIQLVKRRPSLLERFSLIRTAEARSR